MARPKKSTVDYFPHSTQHGKTLFMLQAKWGNDGYAVWFKILERLGSSHNHVIDCNDASTFLYLSAYCGVDDATLLEIIAFLAEVNAIHAGFWRKKYIYSENYVQGIADAYRKRRDSFPTVEKVSGDLNINVEGFPAEETRLDGVSSAGSTEREREREREIKTIVDLQLHKSTKQAEREKDFEIFWDAFNYKKGRSGALSSWDKIKGYTPELFAQILEGAKRESAARPALLNRGATPKMAQGWLTDRRWEDEDVVLGGESWRII